jgi:signal transduction histidine kinase
MLVATRAALGVLLVVVALSAQAQPQPPVKQVLMLQSFDRGILVLDFFTGNFRASLDQSFGKPVNIVQVVVAPMGRVGGSERAVLDYIRSIFADRPPPDLIVTVAGPAAAFARRHRQELFPGTPLLFASVDERWIRDAPLGENESAIAVVNDFPRLIDDILRVLPETREIFMVTGGGPIGRFWRRELEVAFARFRDRVTFVWSDELSVTEILRRCATLPPNSAIVYFSFGTDGQGGAYGDVPVLAKLRATANAPLFAGQSPLLGHGVVGGTMIPIEDLGRDTADVAGRILDGASPASLRLPPVSAALPVFDWRELQRWNIDESRLPPGSSVRFRSPGVWDQYRPAILATLGALFLQSLLIAWLLYERRKRRRAEIDSRRNLALAADANRRETVSALAASISHELGQPLSAIAHNAQALEMMAAAGKAEPEATGEIVADIKAEVVLATGIIERHREMLRSRQLDKKPIDLRAVIDQSLALVAQDMRMRQVEVALDLSSTPSTIEGDPVLLAQVFVNLARNAIDAMAQTPPGMRRLSIRSASTTGGVEVAVSDTGTGLPAEFAETLFAPFVTTKPDGLGIGLAIAQRIVDAHGGTIRAHENPGGGATFTLTLPRRAS